MRRSLGLIELYVYAQAYINGAPGRVTRAPRRRPINRDRDFPQGVSTDPERF